MIKWTDEAIAAFWLAMPTASGPLKRRETELALNAAVKAQGLIQPDYKLDFDQCSQQFGAITIKDIIKSSDW